MTDFESAWERVKEITGWKKFINLADHLGIASSNISQAKAKDNFVLEWARRIALDYDSTVEWILDGRGPKSIDSAPEMVCEAQEPYNVTGGGVFSAREKQIVIMLRSLADGDPVSFENIYQNVVENYMLMKENIR